ncbi:15434_t:CDS:10 [Funneliformis geosporum]|uniref:15434_t:CDS:1 n=1 Tax=Funneliformis geosporum TaxID=1117311 RepID=A0A9W4WW25_9GLOM|nr:15434_t:CDS:10 [Funneliformis geosporum]
MSTGRSSTRPSRLQFKLNFVSASSQKIISTPELIKRLTNLFGEVSVMDQEQVDLESLKGATRELINTNLISHKDQGVKAYVACCISDLLRLYAPDAPYNARELKNIDDKDGPYFDLYFHLLENLARVKIVLLILDLPNCEELLIELFRDFFDIIRSDMSNIVHSHMVDILEQLINDSDGLPQDMIDIILAQFLKQRKDENPAAYQLASEVCNRATDKLQRYVCQLQVSTNRRTQYFTDVIVEADRNGTSTEELNNFKTAHDLIKELNRAAPGLLLNVIPQLEEELKLDDTPLRLLATQVLGEMFSEKDSTLASRYDNVWKMWLLRRNDKTTDIRCAWVEYCLPLYINHHELAIQINEAIISKMLDVDDKVRIAVCKVFGQLEYECASKLVGKELFVEIAQRCRDRKHGVRQEAIKALARLYNMAYIEIVCVEKAMHEEILAFNNGDSARMDRIIGDPNNEKLANILNQTIERISEKLPDPMKSKNNLSTFAKLQDTRVYKLIRDCMNPQSDYKTVRSSAKDALNRIEQIAASSFETFSILIRRISLTIINRDLVPLLMNKIKSVDGEQQNAHSIIAYELFTEISSRFPVIFRSHLERLTTLLKEEDESATIVENSLEALSKFAKAFPDEVPHDSQCALYTPTIYEQESNTIANFIIKELIMKNHNANVVDKTVWVDDNELDDECKAKVLGIKVLVNRLLTITDAENALDLSKPVFKLLWKLIREGGELLPDKSTRPSHKSRLRLAAVRSVLKLARKTIYDSMIPFAEFQGLAQMIQDKCYNIRFAFASQLIKYCGKHQLTTRFLSIFFLIAHDPDVTIREMVGAFLTRYSLASRAIRDKSMHLEMSLVQLIHLLSHHPDFSRETDTLNEFVVYIDFYLDTIANAENISLLSYLVCRLKHVRDVHSPDQCENLYILSDLSQYLIRIKCKSHSWTLLEFPGQVELPSNLFKSLPNPEVRSEIMKKNHIPNEFLKLLDMKLESINSKSSKSEKSKLNKRGPKPSGQASNKKRKADDYRGIPSTSTRKAAKSNIKSMAIISTSSEEELESNDTSEAESDVELNDDGE